MKVTEAVGRTAMKLSRTRFTLSTHASTQIPRDSFIRERSSFNLLLSRQRDAVELHVILAFIRS